MKYYRVKKDTFLWEKDAILQNSSCNGGYVPVDDLFKKFEDCNEYISLMIVENCPEWFERVYPVNLMTKTIYKTKEQAKEVIKKLYK